MSSPAFMSMGLSNKQVKCLACNHKCIIDKGKRGICGVRENQNGELQLLVYGKASCYHIDPIEKKPLYHFYPGSKIFSIGTVGCNFRCKFCQNYDISQYHKDISYNVETVGEDLSPKAILNYCIDNSIHLVAYTYNEPVVFFEYAYDIAKLANNNNLKNVFVSNGFESKESLEKILPYLDAINIDLKSFSDEFYIKICGGKVEPVKDNIRFLFENNVWVEVTTLLITDKNDSEDELIKIAEFLVSISPDIPWHISRYHPAYKMDNPSTSIRTMENAYLIGKKAGLRFVYLGNVSDTKTESTYCHKCNKIIIERGGSFKIENKLNKDKCPYCNEKISGRF